MHTLQNLKALMAARKRGVAKHHSCGCPALKKWRSMASQWKSNIVILACSTDLHDAHIALYAITVWKDLIITVRGLGNALGWWVPTIWFICILVGYSNHICGYAPACGLVIYGLMGFIGFNIVSSNDMQRIHYPSVSYGVNVFSSYLSWKAFCTSYDCYFINLEVQSRIDGQLSHIPCFWHLYFMFLHCPIWCLLEKFFV